MIYLGKNYDTIQPAYGVDSDTEQIPLEGFSAEIEPPAVKVPAKDSAQWRQAVNRFWQYATKLGVETNDTLILTAINFYRSRSCKHFKRIMQDTSFKDKDKAINNFCRESGIAIDDSDENISAYVKLKIANFVLEYLRSHFNHSRVLTDSSINFFFHCDNAAIPFIDSTIDNLRADDTTDNSETSISGDTSTAVTISDNLREKSKVDSEKMTVANSDTQSTEKISQRQDDSATDIAGTSITNSATPAGGDVPSKENLIATDYSTYPMNFKERAQKVDSEIALKHLQATEFELLAMMILKQGECVNKVSRILEAKDFYLPLHQNIFKSIVETYDSGKPPSMITIVEYFRKKGILLDHYSYDRILTLGQAAFTTAYADNYAQIVKENSTRRKLDTISKQLSKAALNYGVDVSELLSELESEVQKLGAATVDTGDGECTFADYFNKEFDADVEEFKQYATRKTGFENLDEKQIFAPGLYFIGAMPSIGKTTFCWQMAMNLAYNGEKIVYCSYETSKAALFAKSVAQEVFAQDATTTLSSTDIRLGGNSLTSRQVVKKFKDRGHCLDLTVIECPSKNIDELLRILKTKVGGDKTLTVFVDYLQIIPPTSTDKNINEIQIINDILRKLKKFQIDNNVTIIFISSFNRASYRIGMCLESFKSSGDIEYYADVAFGLEPKDKQLAFNDFMKSQPREINLVCVKNRFGSLYDVQFNYFSRHDYFSIPIDDDNFATEKNIPTAKNISADEFGE